MSYSQINQDIRVIEFYNHKKNGFFVEIGASDGIELSNTYLLESKYNWTGICAEPIPNKFILLSHNRPNSYCCDKAIFNESNKEVTFNICNSDDLLSGIDGYIGGLHLNTVNDNKAQIKVNTITLNDLLDLYKAPSFIDYLSLDTEGTELLILQAFDFDKYKFGLIDVEHNYQEPTRSEIRKLLLANNYEYLGENQWDLTVVKNNGFSLISVIFFTLQLFQKLKIYFFFIKFCSEKTIAKFLMIYLQNYL